MGTDRQTAVADRLREWDQRYTKGRRPHVDVLEAATRPLTIQEILGRDKALAQSSAYRNLLILEPAGVVHRVLSTDDFARFELAEDLTDHHHHHLICSQSGQVTDFTVAPEVEEALGLALGRAAAAAGFLAHDHRLDLIGQCRRCA